MPDLNVLNTAVPSQSSKLQRPRTRHQSNIHLGVDMFNALKYIKALQDVGFPREQAEAQVQLVMDSFQENVATKSDIADLRAEISELKVDLIFRLGGLIVFCTGVLGLLIKS